MNKESKSYNEDFKERMDKLKKRSNELFSVPPDDDEPQFVGNPNKIFTDDLEEKPTNKPKESRGQSPTP